jgi:hypothetical protein
MAIPILMLRVGRLVVFDEASKMKRTCQPTSRASALFLLSIYFDCDLNLWDKVDIYTIEIEHLSYYI